MLKELTEYEPSSCRCDKCVGTCCSEPGMLAPGDLSRIAAYVGAEPGGQFMLRNFEAAEPRPCTAVGSEHTPPEVCGTVPYVRPAIHKSGIRKGRCVFLTDDDRCSVHPVRPFGCAVCNACEGGNAVATDDCLAAIANDLVYLEMWTEIEFGTKEE